jgi:hypothetical protein
MMRLNYIISLCIRMSQAQVDISLAYGLDKKPLLDVRYASTKLYN